jgi:site-specific DNA-methyltransferase (adenine-specific)
MTITLLQGDCLDWMRLQPDKAFDCVVTDPPYGIDVNQMTLGNGKSVIYRGSEDWDKSTPKIEYFTEMMRVSRFQIIWGGNYFSDKLPPNRCWLVWNWRGLI